MTTDHVLQGRRLVLLLATAATLLASVDAQGGLFPAAPIPFNPGLSHLHHAPSRPEYAFAYGVKDPRSGNAQSHQEQRDGDRVRGQYAVLESDGSVRTVTYTVDPKNGFQADVKQSDPSLAATYKAQSQPSVLSPVISADASEHDHDDHDHEDLSDDFSGGLEDYDH